MDSLSLFFIVVVGFLLEILNQPERIVSRFIIYILRINIYDIRMSRRDEMEYM
jgi:hypothetical protein